jgi:hypothetical protein
MNCRECEFALGCDETNAAVEEHLRGCGSCRQLLEELKANADAFESMSLEEMPRVRVGRPVWPAAIALAAAAVALLLIAIPRVEKLPPVHYALAPMKIEIPAIRPVDTPATTGVRENGHPPLPDGRGSVSTVRTISTMRSRAREQAVSGLVSTHGQPLMVKMLTDDPNVVIYWQIDGDQEGNDK